MSPILSDAKQFLWRHGCAGDVAVDPVELIRDLAIELEKHEGVAIKIKVKKPKARAKPRRHTS
jgi:hypothetical protein